MTTREEARPVFRERVVGDEVVALLGGHRSPTVALLLQALRAEWLTPDEADLLAPLARGVAWIAWLPMPPHRSSRV